MVKEIYIVAKNEKVIEGIKQEFPSAYLLKNVKEFENTKGLVFVNIKDFGIVPFKFKEGRFPVAIINKNEDNTNKAALIMKIMSNNYFDYIEFPFSKKDIDKLISEIKNKENNEKKIYKFRNKSKDETVLCQYLCSIIGSSPKLKEICKISGEVAPTDLPILITGETGTGKELLARGIWRLSKRSDKPFIAINCAAIPENLLEAELFGYEKGAFTGAETQKKGKFEIANGGTIFLDEIGELPLISQSKLLRVLQEGTFYRVGGEKEVKVDVRIIAATNRNLEKMVKEGKFREDLYYRLNIIHLNLPPLRERKDDIPFIVECIVDRYNEKLNKNITGASVEYIEKLKERKWEGNIRELENVVVRSMVFCRDNILTISDLEFLNEEKSKNEKSNINFEKILEEKIEEYLENGCINKLEEEIEKIKIKKALEYTNFNQSKAAEILGINRLTLRKKIKQYNIL
jgi:two-component system nitrogen regulation response regulator GlnG